MTNSSQTRMAVIAESTWGTTPSTPAFQELRYTSESLKANIQNTTSNEIRADRNVSDLIQVGQSAGGAISFELSYGTLDDILESVFYESWSTNVLKNGVTEKSFTIEKTFESGATDQYHRFPGSVADSLTLNLTVGNVVTGSVGFVCKGIDSAQTAIAGSSYTAGNTNEVINVATNFASLVMTGVTSPELTEITINITNNLRQQQVLGSLDARGIGAGRFQVSGTITGYFEDEEMFELFLNGTSADLTFEIGGASSKKYEFAFDNIKFSDGEVMNPGNDQDIMATMQFTALYDATAGASAVVTRTP